MLNMARLYAPNRIRELRQARGMSMESLGLSLAEPVTLATIAKLETQKMALSLDYMQQIADVLGVQPHELIDRPMSGIAFIPKIGKIAAGNWQEAVKLTQEYTPIPNGISGKRLFALEAMGDSMDRLIPDGGFVVIDPDRRELVHDKVYAAMNSEGDTTVKRYCESPPRLVPCSTNPAHKPLVFGEDPVIVIGRVVYVGARLD